MRTLESLLPIAVLACFANTTSAQRLVALDGAGPFVNEWTAPPLTAPWTPIPPPCNLGISLPPFPPGHVFPSLGGEAIDEMGGMLYASDGFVVVSTPYPGCAPSPPIPWVAWPPGRCGPIGLSPVLAMCDAAGVGTMWILEMSGLVSLVPFPPGPPLLQAFAPIPASGALMTSMTWDPITGDLFFTEAGTPLVFRTATPAASTCAPLPILGTVPIPPCLPPPFIGITANTTTFVPPGGIPPLYVTDGVLMADLSTGTCPKGFLPPAATPVTDLEFAAAPHKYGVACGAGPTMRMTGGLPVLGNAAFGIGAGPTTGALGILLVSGAPGFTPLSPTCNLHVAAPWVALPGVAVIGGFANATLPIPPTSFLLVGAPVYCQWFFLPASTPWGFELSDAMEVTVGFP